MSKLIYFFTNTDENLFKIQFIRMLKISDKIKQYNMVKKRDQSGTQLIGLEREAAHTAFREGENAPSLSQQRFLALP